MDNYHTKAQKYITSAKKKGMTVKAEKGELIAYPKGSKAKPTKDSLFEKTRKKVFGLK